MDAVGDIAVTVPEIPLEYGRILKDEGGFWDGVNRGYLPEDLVLAARREEIARVRSEGVFEIVSMQEGKDAGKNPLELIWVDTDKSVYEQIRWRRCAREYKMERQGKINEL